METFFDLLKDPAHWEFEIFLIIIFDVIIGLFIWPFVQKALVHHKSDHERLEELEEEVKKMKDGLNSR
jgi:hypothetical protein